MTYIKEVFWSILTAALLGDKGKQKDFEIFVNGLLPLKSILHIFTLQ